MSLLGFVIVICILSYNGAAGKKSFKNEYGDIYNCVDFYKQPSFDLPILKNHGFHHLMRPSFLANMKGNMIAEKNKPKRERCPIGSVPIRRFTNDASRVESFVSVNEPSGIYDAGVRTKPGSAKYGGGGTLYSVWNPPFVKPSAYSQARIKVSSGPDSIQAGWRVDPSLRGDNRTRQYIYTDAGQSRCFDAQCGFVIVNPEYPLDVVLEPVSRAGAALYVDIFNITRDESSGHWWFLKGFDGVEIGFWPKNIFTGLGDLASDVEWAGEVYSPPDVEEPSMGSGYKPEVDDLKYVAYFGHITVVNENYTSIDADNLEEFVTDRSLYDVKDKGDAGPGYHRLALYGGARY